MGGESSNSAGIRLRRLDIERVEEELKESCIALGKSLPILTVILFGSLSKGNYTGSSDADLLLVTRKAPKDIGERYRLFNRIKANIPVQLLVLTEEEVVKRILAGDTFIIEAITTGKPLIGQEYYEKLSLLCKESIKKHGLKRTEIGWIRVEDK